VTLVADDSRDNQTSVIQTFRPGSLFGGRSGDRFEIKREVGRGAQGLVFLALDHRLNREVAIKVCTAASGLQQQEFLRRFDREMKLTSRVNHPHILSIYDCDETSDGCPYVVLEWMAGGALDGFAQRTRAKGLHTPLPWIGYYTSAIAAGLRAVHARQIVHRDIKPDNVLVNAEGVAKITDFGIAKDVSEGAVPLTEIGMALGTLGFVAPEQLRGLPVSQSDIFSLGATVYALVTGKVLPQKKREHIPLGIPLPEAWVGLPPDLAGFIKKLTAPRLDDRAADLQEVRALIDGVDWQQQLGPVVAASELPPLPSSAFISGATTALTAVAEPLAETAESLVDLASEDIAAMSTADFETESSGASAPPSSTERTSAEPEDIEPDPPGSTRLEIRANSLTGAGSAAPGSEALGSAAPGSAASGSVAQVVQDSPEPDAVPGKRSAVKRFFVALVACAATAVLGLAITQKLAGPADPQQVSAALEHLQAGATAGTWAASFASVGELPAQAANLPEGQLLTATDRLLAGDRQPAQALNPASYGADTATATSAGLLLAASQRLAGPTGYSSAVTSYEAALGCEGAPCRALRERARRGLREACLVAGPTTGPCKAQLVGLSEREVLLGGGLVLQGDGHSDVASVQLQVALAQLTSGPPASCVELAALQSWAQDGAVSESTVATIMPAIRRSARSPQDCSPSTWTAPQ